MSNPCAEPTKIVANTVTSAFSLSSDALGDAHRRTEGAILRKTGEMKRLLPIIAALDRSGRTAGHGRRSVGEGSAWRPWRTRRRPWWRPRRPGRDRGGDRGGDSGRAAAAIVGAIRATAAGRTAGAATTAAAIAAAADHRRKAGATAAASPTAATGAATNPTAPRPTRPARGAAGTCRRGPAAPFPTTAAIACARRRADYVWVRTGNGYAMVSEDTGGSSTSSRTS